MREFLDVASQHFPARRMRFASSPHPTSLTTKFNTRWTSLKFISSMHRHHAARHVEIFDALQSGLDHHLLQLFLSRMHADGFGRSEEHTSELQSLRHLVCRLLLE